MHLDIDGILLPVHQLGPDFAIIEATSAHAPGPGKLSILVDDILTIRPVFLPEGIHPGNARTRLALA